MRVNLQDVANYVDALKAAKKGNLFARYCVDEIEKTQPEVVETWQRMSNCFRLPFQLDLFELPYGA